MKAGTELLMALFMAVLMRSTGTGKMTVLLFSAEMLLRVCRYRNCSKDITRDSEEGGCANKIVSPSLGDLSCNEE